MSELTVLVDRDGPVAIVTLNRPDAMNALSRELLRAFTAALRTLSADPDVSVIVLTGAGGRAFCAGLDLKELGQNTDLITSDSSDDMDPVAAMTACSKPIVGAVNGVAITGGFEVALGCDILVGSTAARFADTHVKVQVVPGWGLSQKLSRIIGVSRAKQMSLTGAFIDARRALDWGLLNEVVAPEALLPLALSIAKGIAGNDADMVARYKALIDDGLALPLGDALKLEHARADAFNRKIDAAAIEGRRGKVFEDNRSGGAS